MTWSPPGQGTKKRDSMPASCFLDSKDKKYPYKTKKNGKWEPSKAGLRAAISRSAMQHDTNINHKAERLYKKYFK